MFTSEAQENVLDSDPLGAHKLLVYDQLGLYIGPSFNGQGGTIVTDCKCEFTGGAKAGYNFGMMFERLTRSRLTWGVSLGYEDKSVEGRFTQIESVVQNSPTTGNQYTIPITFKNSALASIGYVTGMPFLKYFMFDLIYVRAGVPVSYIVSSNLKQTKTLESDSATFPNGETASISIPGSNNGSVVVQDKPLDGVQTFQVGMAFAAGMDFKVGRKLFLGPVMQYIHPLTNVNSSDVGFSVRSLQFLVECRLIL